MAYTFGARIDDDSYALTTIDEDQGTASTKGMINGVPFESGGGGSSDFSTAEVTITNSLNQGIRVLAANCVDDDGYILSAGYMDTPPEESVVLTAVLYKGVAEIYIPDDLAEFTASTGEVEVDESNKPYATISGNCTLTIGELQG